MREPERPSSGNSLLNWALQAWHYMRANMPKAGPGIEVYRSTSGTIISLKKKVGGTAAGPCAFGEIITYSEQDEEDSAPSSKTGIRGGYLEAGDKIWQVAPREINLEASGVFLIWLKLAVTANTDPENVAVLSGLKTSAEPTWQSGSESDDYEDKVIPEIFPVSDPGAGILIVPIGVLTIADGRATLARTGCGNIIADHCPGTLSHHRGPVITGSDSL